MFTSSFRHPEPGYPRQKLIPVFIPFAGCPGRCIYCAQHEQTGEGSRALGKSLDRLRADLESRKSRGQTDLGVAFYGGTFTALSTSWQKRFLSLAGRYKIKGVVSHIRCSTRPDCICARELMQLKELGLDMVELGIQSFSRKVLKASGRGYSARIAEKACATVRHSGLGLGIQLLPGLPGHNMDEFHKDINRVCSLAPETLRIYPCLVIGETELTRMWRAGCYTPWSLEKTICAVSLALPGLWEKKIKVIRIGLARENTLFEHLHAGPWHSSLGSICRGRALRDIVLINMAAAPGKTEKILVPEKYISDFWGYKRENRRAYQRAGVYPEKIKPHAGKDFILFSKREAGS